MAHIGDGEVPNQDKCLIPEQDWTSGWLYTHKTLQMINSNSASHFSPRDENQYFFPKDISVSLNDCIVHAINFCLRFPWFTQREQAYRLIKENNHRTEAQIAATKVQLGYKVEDFDDFAVHGDKSFSLTMLSDLKWCKDL